MLVSYGFEKLYTIFKIIKNKLIFFLLPWVCECKHLNNNLKLIYFSRYNFCLCLFFCMNSIKSLHFWSYNTFWKTYWPWFTVKRYCSGMISSVEKYNEKYNYQYKKAGINRILIFLFPVFFIFMKSRQLYHPDIFDVVSPIFLIQILYAFVFIKIKY